MKNIGIMFFLCLTLAGGCSAQKTHSAVSITDLKFPPELAVTQREQWGWEPVTRGMVNHEITHVTIHHGGTDFADDRDVADYLRALQSWSRFEKDWIDIPYHFIIDLHGGIWEARPINFPGDTNTTYDPSGHALIAVAGNYEKRELSPVQLDSLVALTTFLVRTYGVSIDNIRGHMDYAETDCPGKNIYRYLQDGTIQGRVAKNLESEVLPGVEVLVRDYGGQLKGRNVAILTNPTGVTRKLESTIDAVRAMPGVNVVRLFSPEHGLRGQHFAGEKVNETHDPVSGIPVMSLYGATRKPTPEMLEGLDLVLYDIQDVGHRTYTFVSTLTLLMEA